MRDLVPVSEEYKLYQMEDALLSVFADTLSAVFTESIEISVYTTATIIDDNNTTVNDENTDLDGVVTDTIIETAPIVVEWISAEQLKNDYNLNYWWNEEEIQLFNDSERFIISGSPKSSFEHDQIYNGSCNGITVRFKYSSVTNYNSGNIFFYYDDLISAGII